MEANVNDWKLIAVRVMSQHRIHIEVVKILGPYIKFQLETPIERNWFMQIVKRNFFKIMESVPIENIEPLSFVINEKYNPNHIENFDIYEVTPPKMSDRINFKNIEIKNQTDSGIKLSNNPPADILPPTAMFVNPRPDGFGDTKVSVTKEKEFIDLEVNEKVAPISTWKEFFKKLNFKVYLRRKFDVEKKFIRWEIYFSDIKERRAFEQTKYFNRYKFSVCIETKKKLLIHRLKPDPE